MCSGNADRRLLMDLCVMHSKRARLHVLMDRVLNIKANRCVFNEPRRSSTKSVKLCGWNGLLVA